VLARAHAKSSCGWAWCEAQRRRIAGGATWTTFVVIGSYLWFAILTRLYGQTWADKQTDAL
jgi:hypothetical protein